MNNVEYVDICANQGVNKCNLLVLPDPGLNLPVNWGWRFQIYIDMGMGSPISTRCPNPYDISQGPAL